MIREATLKDMAELRRMGALFHAMSPYRDIPFIADDFAASMARAIADENCTVKVAGENDVVGMAVAILFPPIFNTGVRIAQELLWFAEQPGAGRALLDALEEWAKARGADTMLMADLPAIRSLKAVYERRGYEPAESMYFRSL